MRVLNSCWYIRIQCPGRTALKPGPPPRRAINGTQSERPVSAESPITLRRAARPLRLFASSWRETASTLTMSGGWLYQWPMQSAVTRLNSPLSDRSPCAIEAGQCTDQLCYEAGPVSTEVAMFAIVYLMACFARRDTVGHNPRAIPWPRRPRSLGAPALSRPLLCRRGWCRHYCTGNGVPDIATKLLVQRAGPEIPILARARASYRHLHGCFPELRAIRRSQSEGALSTICGSGTTQRPLGRCLCRLGDRRRDRHTSVDAATRLFRGDTRRCVRPGVRVRRYVLPPRSARVRRDRQPGYGRHRARVDCMGNIRLGLLPLPGDDRVPILQWPAG